MGTCTVAMCTSRSTIASDHYGALTCHLQLLGMAWIPPKEHTAPTLPLHDTSNTDIYSLKQFLDCRTVVFLTLGVGSLTMHVRREGGEFGGRGQSGRKDRQ